MQNPFSSITAAGLLLPIDLLTRVSSMDRALPGMSPADYHIPGSIRLNEAATAAYSRALAYWKSFRKKFDALPASDSGTTLTRDEWLLPLFECLGYGRLQTKRMISIDDKEYPISHGWEDHVPIHLLSAKLPLDKRTQNVSGAATRSPYSLVQELLNRSSKHRWGFVSNGLKLYLLRDNASLTRSANVEFDLESMMDGEYHADFTVLFLICHQSRLEIQPTPIVDNKSSNKKAAKPAKAKRSTSKVAEKLGKYDLDLDDEASEESELDVDEEAIEIDEPTRLGPENCWLEAWTKLAGEQGTRAKERLRDGVQLAIQTFGAGFYTCPSNALLHERLRSGELSTQDYYRQLLRLVYRLLMLMVAEDKRTESGQNLLHPIDTPAYIRDRYNQFYSVGRIRKLANERRGTPHRDLYECLKTTFLKLRDGYAPLGIPGIGSFLFSDTATPDLDTAQITNEALLDSFRHLCFTDDATGRGGSIRRAVDFGNLGSEELGSIYESLLELHPEIDSQEGPFVLRTAAGNERKTSGSYYTPTSLINCLLDSALDPVVNQAIDVPDREEAKHRLLNLKVCDPACGSGHFLIAAANRMALHLARLETQDTEPTTLQIQHAKRSIIGRCIYGVDVNPMAVELCKVSLWMEALEPGRPLSFLDHHIQCGNSLLGATPALLKQGIPDVAFAPIEGDVKAVASDLRKQNKKERTDRQRGQGQLEFELSINLGNLLGEFTRLSSTRDDSVTDIAEKERRYAELVSGADYQNARLLSDKWCAVFVWQKDTSDLGKLCPTENDFRRIEKNPHSILPHVKSEVRRLADQYQFFHWHLAFPDVFRLPGEGKAENEQTGWNAGFDVVLGNPPWDQIQVNDKEFFSSAAPDIANTPHMAARKKAIAGLQKTDPGLFNEYQFYVRHLDATQHFIHTSSRYPLGSVGRLNTAPLFLESALDSISQRGRAGLIVPSGIATDSFTQQLFRQIMFDGHIRSLYEFENVGFFAGAGHGHMNRFCLLTMLGERRKEHAESEFLFQGQDIGELSDPERRFTLTSDDFVKLNPNTKTCPIFRLRKDAEILRHVYGRLPIIENEVTGESAWAFKGLLMFMMNSASGLFRTRRDLLDAGYRHTENRFVGPDQTYVPLYEAKLMYQFQHRHGDFNDVVEGKSAHKLPPIPPDRLTNPTYAITPRYWVPEDEAKVRLDDKWRRKWFLGWRDVTDSRASARTVVSAIIPYSGASHKLPIFTTDEAIAEKLGLLLANLNSFALDYVARQKVGGTALTFFYLKQFAIVPLHTYQENAPWCGSDIIDRWVRNRILELTYTAWDLEAFALDCGYAGPPFRWDEERRFLLRCELDAAYFHLYLGPTAEWGANSPQLREMFPTPRHAVEYIMDTFPIVRRKDEAKYGAYRTKRVILEIYDQMTEIIEANEAIRAANPGKSEEELRPLLRSYQSPLNPPPGPPTDADGNFIPYADWTEENHRQYAGVIHPPKRSLVGLPKLELMRDLLLVLEAWQVPASISAIEPALILMRDDRARALLSGDSPRQQPNSAKREPVRIEGLQTIYLTLEANQTIAKVGESGYRLAKPEVTVQFPDSIKAKARQAVAIVKSFAEPAELSSAVASECCFNFELAADHSG